MLADTIRPISRAAFHRKNSSEQEEERERAPMMRKDKRLNEQLTGIGRESRLFTSAALRRILTSSLAIWMMITLIDSHSLGHSVGEPELEKLAIWSHCCNDHDCVPQPVSIIRDEEKSLLVNIAGFQTSVERFKFTPVPSSRTWVCYVVPNGVVNNDNIRCILHPKPGGVM